MNIQFLGANRQVTGSRYLIEGGGLRLLVDCGMFQERAFTKRNWESSPVPPDTIDYLLLTHAHLDHSGLIPKLVAEGFDKPILTTAPSVELAEIILSDAAHIQEEDAKYKIKRHKREGRKPAHPVVPLFTAEDVDRALHLFRATEYSKPVQLNENVSVTFHDAGHILGSAMLELKIKENGLSRTVIFSGDIGQCDKPIIRDPTMLDHADYIVMESTYGDRDHGKTEAVEDQLCDVVNNAVAAGGNIIIPTFAVERAQELMYHLGRLMSEKRIPHLMAFLDSPMAVNVTDVFRRHRYCMDEEAHAILDAGEELLRFPGLNLVRSTAESKAINRIKGSCIIMAGSGMCTAGRVKHHLVNNVSSPECTVVIVGYQANGTLGRRLVQGDSPVRIHGREHEVNATIEQIHGFSAHADRAALLKWLGNFGTAPKRIFLSHGEESGAEKLASEIRAKWGWTVDVPEYQDRHELT